MLAVLILAGLLGGCARPDEPEEPAYEPSPILFRDEHNYGYVADIGITAVEVQAGSDVTLDWCSLTTDLRGLPIADPSGIDQLILVEYRHTREQIESKIERNELLDTSFETSWRFGGPGACTVAMSDLTMVGTPLPPSYLVEDPDVSWLLMLWDVVDDEAGLTDRVDTLMTSFVVPLDDSTNTAVEVSDSSSVLTVEVDLHSAPPLEVNAGDAPMLDWSKLTVDVHGGPYDPFLGDRLLVGKIPVETVAEVEDVFLQLDLAAEELYFADVWGSTETDLSLAASADGELFGGFTTDGTWLVGIDCEECIRVPLLLSVVEVD